MRQFAPLAALALTLAACNAPAPSPSPPPAPGSPETTPSNFQLPPHGDCRAEIARYRAIQDNDLASGNVDPSVYNEIKREIDAAARTCAAGHDAEAKAMIVASKRRHGYPTDF